MFLHGIGVRATLKIPPPQKFTPPKNFFGPLQGGVKILPPLKWSKNSIYPPQNCQKISLHPPKCAKNFLPHPKFFFWNLGGGKFHPPSQLTARTPMFYKIRETLCHV